MFTPEQMRCRPHGKSLIASGAEGQVESSATLTCDSGCSIPVIKGIPRFVNSNNYASGFGLQWNTFRKTQLDSFTGTTISRDRLTRCLGGSLETLREKSVLEVGCGAGRFTEILLSAGSKVFACDLSQAVEANYANCGTSSNYFVCQSDVRTLPVAPHSFEIVICLGVIQHTPSPEETIAALAGYVKAGGMLVIDHYSHGYPRNFLQRNIRGVLVNLPARIAKPLALTLAHALLPLHRLTWKNWRGSRRLRANLLRYSPLIDYHDAYSQLGDRLLSEWSVLDTHDSLTDYYKHLRTTEEIETCLRKWGLIDIEVSYGGNGVEARGRMPS